jgi:RNA-directed DNA polymerase
LNQLFKSSIGRREDSDIRLLLTTGSYGTKLLVLQHAEQNHLRSCSQGIHLVQKEALARRISDRKLLWLLKRWLKRPVAERTGRGRWRDPGGKRATRGIPQGGVISPLLATLDMKRSRRACRQAGLARRDGARLVNEADDVVVRCRQGAAAVLAQTRQWVQQRGVTWNEQETRRCNGRQEPVTFLGYTGGPRVYRKDGHW